MAALAESMLRQSVRALMHRDDTLAERVEIDEILLDRTDKIIDQLAHRRLSGAPLAGDLRLVTAGMKIACDLERIGDESCKIARCARVLCCDRPWPEGTRHLPLLAIPVMAALNQSLCALAGREPERARASLPGRMGWEKQGEKISHQLTQAMAKQQGFILPAITCLVAVQSLERIGGHAENIAEKVIFLCEGRDIRSERPHLTPDLFHPSTT